MTTARIEAEDIQHVPVGGRVGILAGGGTLPVDVARRLVERGHTPFVLSIAGENSTAGDVSGVEAASVSLEEMGSVVSTLRAHGVERVILAGTIARRPALRDVKWSIGLLSMLPYLVRGLRSGDDGALRSIMDYLEARGLHVVAAHEIVPDLLADTGALGHVVPSADDWRDIEAARAAALAIGTLDIGQAAIAIGGRAVALEGVEGTDGLLERMVALRDHGRIARRERGVLAKFMKPGQDRRADLPAIGPATVHGAKAARLAGIVVEAGRSLVLEREKTVTEADRLGLFIVGVTSDGRRA